MTNYKTWYNTTGYKKEEDLRIWLESCPKWYNLDDLINNVDEFVQGELDAQFEAYIGDINDRAYNEWRDNR